ncbi:MAG: LptF/LptG family permease [Pseudoflavonifractor sp.]|nr:LptF/LptG family permease [Pseudoflavonifractor sp.]
MLKIKRLYLFMLQSFLPLFFMTFFICLFIILMQFLWRYIDELVGKGLEVTVIAELFFYAALTMVPMALPLAILLASLMTFGNLGERFELTAMKASGVSLVKTMRPLIVLMILVAIGAFFFQNNVLPLAQTKMWTLLYSMRQKSPELDIPEGVFYDQIPGYNLFVKTKNRDTGILHDMMIYNVSKGFDNASIILADSGKLSITADKTHLYLQLWTGESFENLRNQGGSAATRNVPYRRESFSTKEILVPFDANFNRMDDNAMRNQYVGKNITELQATIDSVNIRLDSIGTAYGTALKEAPYFGLSYRVGKTIDGKAASVRQSEVALDHPLDVDSVFAGSNAGYAKSYLQQALQKAKRTRQDYEYKSYSMQDDRKTIRRHGIELMKKFTLSFACIIFFFIGAPLGAIIRKGGLGTPLVISVLLFIFYYIIDNTGYKMARDGRIEVWIGMWLSSAVLLPLGVFFTYKAVNDSAVFNRDAYVAFFRKLFGRNEKRHMEMKEVVMTEVIPSKGIAELKSLASRSDTFLQRYQRRQGYTAYWLYGYDRNEIRGLSADLERIVEYLSNSRDRMVIIKLMELPVMRSLWLYHPSSYRIVSYMAIALFPIGLPLYILGLYNQRRLKVEIGSIKTISSELIAILAKDTANIAPEPPVSTADNNNE